MMKSSSGGVNFSLVVGEQVVVRTVTGRIVSGVVSTCNRVETTSGVT